MFCKFWNDCETVNPKSRKPALNIEAIDVVRCMNLHTLLSGKDCLELEFNNLDLEL